MSDNFLKLNADKTELILIGNPKRVAKVQHFELTVGDSAVRPSTSARNLIDKSNLLTYCLFLVKKDRKSVV